MSPSDHKRVTIFRRSKFRRVVLHYDKYGINTPTKFIRFMVHERVEETHVTGVEDGAVD